MARKPNTTSRRAEIVNAMLHVMARQGYERATIQAIAQEAGLAPGLIHYHFKNKQEILVSLVKSIAEFAKLRSADAATGAMSAIERLQIHLESRVGLGPGAAPDMVAAWVVIGAESVRITEVRELYQQVIANELAALTALLSDCMNERGRDPGGAHQLAAGLVAMVEGAFHLSCSAGSTMPVGYAANAAMTFARLSIEAAAPRSDSARPL